MISADKRFLQEPDPVDDELYVPPQKDWSDDHALSVVTDDYSRASQYRYANHDYRWNSADNLYAAWVSPKYWEGTRVQRSSIGVFLAFETVEAMLPRIIQALFGDDPWFDVEAMTGTTVDAARTVRDVLLNQLEQVAFPETLRRAIKSALVYGNGLVKLSWEYRTGTKTKYLPVFIPESARRTYQGKRMQVPTQGYRRSVKEIEVPDVVNRPKVCYVPLKWFYIDPNCMSPCVQDARYVVERCFMTVDELDALRDTEGYRIPDKFMLIMLSHSKPYDHSDWTMGAVETARQGSWRPDVDQTSDPAGRRIEVLYYWTADRLVMTLNRTWVMYNEPNPYGFIPFYNIVYADMMDRFYALAVTDVVEGEQRLQQQIVNARIDELALSIHPPTIVKRGNNQPTYKLRVRPGALSEAEDPSRDIIRQYPQNITQQSYMEVQASEQRAQRSTGVTDFAMLGASGGANPALRTATGASTQAQASFSRVQYLIEAIERTVLEPLLRDMHTLNQMYLDPDQIMEATAEKKIDPVEIFGAKVRMAIRAGSRMQSRQGLLQTLPLILQTVLNPALLQHLSVQGLTIDWSELMQMMVEATGYKRKSTLFRKMTPQEQQAMQQQQQMAMMPEMVKMKMQSDRMEKLHDMQTDQGDIDMLKESLRGAIAAATDNESESATGGSTSGSHTKKRAP